MQCGDVLGPLLLEVRWWRGCGIAGRRMLQSDGDGRLHAVRLVHRTRQVGVLHSNTRQTHRGKRDEGLRAVDGGWRKDAVVAAG